ncbi:MAG: hypothetical protein MUO85_00595, partial [candidate division Zixibacteria bacterium]|nr:hypothetical protein [candidate division Zixibacteria bacterium]
FKTQTEIPNQVRDDKNRKTKPCCHAELVSASTRFSISGLTSGQACFFTSLVRFFYFQQMHLSSLSTGRGFQVRS